MKMDQKLNRCGNLAAIVMALFMFAGTANANMIVNGDFEALNDTVVRGSSNPSDFPENWEAYYANCPGDLVTGTAAIGGSGASLLLTNTSNGGMWQELSSPTGQLWEFEMDFACTDPGTGSSQRAFRVMLEHGLDGGGDPVPDSGQIIMQVADTYGTGYGDLLIHNGSGYAVVPGLVDVVPFSSDIATPDVHHIKIVGDYMAGDGTDTPRYSVFLTAGSTTYESGWISNFVNGAPASNNVGVFGVTVASSYMGSSARTVLDNLSVTAVPEPSSLAMLSMLSVMAGLAWRRRKNA